MLLTEAGRTLTDVGPRPAGRDGAARVAAARRVAVTTVGTVRLADLRHGLPRDRRRAPSAACARPHPTSCSGPTRSTRGTRSMRWPPARTTSPSCTTGSRCRSPSPTTSRCATSDATAPTCSCTADHPLAARSERRRSHDVARRGLGQRRARLDLPPVAAEDVLRRRPRSRGSPTSPSSSPPTSRSSARARPSPSCRGSAGGRCPSDVVAVPIVDPVSERTVSLVWRRTMTDRPALAAAVNALAAEGSRDLA